MTDLTTSLITEMDIGESRSARRTPLSASLAANAKLLLATVVLTVAITVGLFVGGYFLGRNEASSGSRPAASTPGSTQPLSSSSSSASAAPTTNALLASMGSSNVMLTAIAGAVPVQTFMQCVMVARSVTDINCVPVNSVLTVPGTVMVIFYQYNGASSLLVTATGSAYGSAAPFTDVIEANFTLTVSGLQGFVGSDQLPPASLTIASQDAFAVHFTVRPTDTYNVVFESLSITPALAASVAVSGQTGGLSFALLDSLHMQAQHLAGFPTPALPLALTWPYGGAPMKTAPSITSTTVFSNPTVSITHNVGLTAGGLRRRSASSADAAAASQVMVLRDTNGDPIYRLESYIDRLSGVGLHLNVSLLADNGTVVDSMHFALFAAEQVSPLASVTFNTSHIFTTMKRRFNDTAASVGTVAINGSSARFHVLAESISAPPAWVIEAMQLAQAHASAAADAIQAAGTGSKDNRRWSWVCDWNFAKGLYGTYSCVQDGMEVYASGGADIFADIGTVSDCYGAIKDWVQVYNDC